MVFSLMVGPIVGGWLVWSNGLGLWLWLYGWLSNGWFFILRLILRVFCCFQLDGWAWTYFRNGPNAAASIAPTLIRPCPNPNSKVTLTEKIKFKFG